MIHISYTLSVITPGGINPIISGGAPPCTKIVTMYFSIFLGIAIPSSNEIYGLLENPPCSLMISQHYKPPLSSGISNCHVCLPEGIQLSSSLLNFLLAGLCNHTM